MANVTVILIVETRHDVKLTYLEMIKDSCNSANLTFIYGYFKKNVSV